MYVSSGTILCGPAMSVHFGDKSMTVEIANQSLYGWFLGLESL